MTLKTFRIIFGLLIFVGTYLIVKSIYIVRDDGDLFLTPNRIKTEEFFISTNKDTTLIGHEGTKLVIRKNSFVDLKGNIIRDSVLIELKEIISKPKIILAGLVTRSDQKILETGGMIYLNAYHNKKVLNLIDSLPIIAIVPTDNKKEGMKLFKGEKSENGINWINPKSLIEKPDTFISAHGFIPDGTTEKEAIELGFVNRDTLVLASNGDTIYFTGNNEQLDEISDDFNTYKKYYSETTYILEILNFGWLNIDRFLNQSESKIVKFELIINNGEQFDVTNTYMVFNDLNILINGWDLSEGHFVFGKSQNAKVKLPIGEKISLITFGYKNKNLYYNHVETKITETQVVNVTLKKATVNEIVNLINQKY